MLPAWASQLVAHSLGTVGSGVLAPDAWLDTGRQLLKLLEKLPDVRYVDVGGGLGVPEKAGQTGIDLRALDEALADIKQGLGERKLWLEPGRYVVAQAGVLLARVTQTKGKGDVQYVGVATGMVVLAEASNPALPHQTEVIGITPALAARIQSEAAPNSVAVAEATYRLTNGVFEFEEIGRRELKGFGEPVALWRPIARRQRTDRFTASRRVSAPLVGRDDEIEVCRQRWTSARDGNGQPDLRGIAEYWARQAR